ncbi:MAG: nicotinate phosphoribosyltransferase [Desulfurobacteriaceae bacterium]
MAISPLLTDLYQLTMMKAYLDNGKTEEAAFELFVRELPENRNYLIFCGLEEVFQIVENLRFSESDIDYLYSLKLFPDHFLDFLKEFRFTGKVYSIRDGTPFFAQEPVLRVEAPIYQAQLLETALMNQVHISSLAATKAARIYTVARGRAIADFSLRRTHGSDAGLKVAKYSYVAGFNGTSNVLAGKLYRIPVIGTVAHSFIMSFEGEGEAFRAYLRSYPDKAVLLVDTYDTVEGVRRAIEAAKEMGVELKGVRLDSGNVVELSKLVRKILNEAGFERAKIIVSGGLDEYRIDEILKAGAEVDAFGVGTKFGVSSDSPYIDFVYKLVEVGGKPVMKTSPGKKMYPGKKQVFREREGDVVGVWGEELPGRPLLELVMEGTERMTEVPPLKEIRDYCISQLENLPEEVKDIRKKAEYPVTFSRKLEELYRETLRKIEEEEGELS